MTNIRDYDPTKGSAFQGDVLIKPMPDEIPLAADDEVKPVGGRLILQEGEVTGHHHAVTLTGREAHFRRETGNAVADPFAGASPELQTALRGKPRAARKVGTARMFRDPAAARAMVSLGVLARADLCVGFMLVEGGPVVVTHDEHDGIRLPEGRYYIGRQVESVGAEERAVAD